MNESENKLIKPISKFTIISFYTSIATLLLLAITFLLPEYTSWILGVILVLICYVAIICGIVGFFKVLKNEKISGLRYATLGIIFSFIVVVLIPIRGDRPPPSSEIVCAVNLIGLSKATLVYTQDNNELFPAPDQWCDLLIKYCDVQEKMFICPKAKKAGSKARCHYAINPNASPICPKDMVVLFETKGGWNQFGGDELITAENHDGIGCNVGFVDTHVEFVKKEDFGKLNWGTKK